ncbi:MAG TPA: amidohydrolase family protein [Sphingomicrobium sp.]|jgi:imidazolonepropionase-like amidohydrolase|nr:amidohydrolase family protein [Sphingomicrobium sp.]
MIGRVAAALLLGVSVPACAQTFAIVGGTVALGDGSEPIPNGMVVVRDGRILAAGNIRMKLPDGTQVIDATGKWVTPGIVAGFSRLGLTDVSGGAEGANDESADKSPFNAAIDIAPAINPNYQPVGVNRADGVTRAVVAPRAEHSIFAGQGAVIDTGADLDPITKRKAFQFVELGQNGAESAGGSRPSAYVLFHDALREAAELSRYTGPVRSAGASAPDDRMRPTVQNPNETRLYSHSAERSQDVLLTRFDAAALVPVLQGRQPLLVHVERASDILNVLDLKREFPSLKIVIVGASEGWLVAGQIAKSSIPVIASALVDLPESFEEIASTQSNIGRMKAAGVNVSIGMINDDDAHKLFYERQYAGNLVALRKIPGATGVTWGEALAMITSKPAEAVGLGDEIGRLAPGEHADVVIWSGDPLEVMSGAEQVFIDGVEQPLETHQKRLLERYRSLQRTDLPMAYRH